MRVCLCVYLYVYMDTCISIFIQRYVCVCTHTYVHVYVTYIDNLCDVIGQYLK